MIAEIKEAAVAALARVAAAETAGEVRALEAELLGKRGPFAGFKSGLAGLATVAEREATTQS